MNCVVYMDLRPLGGLKFLKLGNFLLKMIPVLEGLKPLLPRLTSLLIVVIVTGVTYNLRALRSSYLYSVHSLIGKCIEIHK